MQWDSTPFSVLHCTQQSTAPTRKRVAWTNRAECCHCKAHTWSIAKQLQKVIMPAKNRRIDGACHPAIASVWRFLQSTGGVTLLQGLSWKTLMSWTSQMCSSAYLCHVLNWLVSMYDRCHKAWIERSLWWIGLIFSFDSIKTRGYRRAE